ncbi:MAG: hypothetical protein QG607_525 [Patescibacteria group bacterium]|nr:hypothetical protein [Patescibacteria group bacterium]
MLKGVISRRPHGPESRTDQCAAGADSSGQNVGRTKKAERRGEAEPRFPTPDPGGLGAPVPGLARVQGGSKHRAASGVHPCSPQPCDWWQRPRSRRLKGKAD